MRPRDALEMTLLAALWGASFLLMKMGALDFGPVALSAVRVAVAGAVLLPLVWWHRLGPVLRRHWSAIAVVGVVNSALPFLAYSFAMLAITAGLGSVFNATSPLWGALIAWLWLGERLVPSRVLGLAIGFAGVLWLAWDKSGLRSGAGLGSAGLAVAACLGATLCYGFGANLTRRYLSGVPPLAVAAGSQVAAALVLAPWAWFAWPAVAPSATAWGLAALLGAACTGLAYLLYFRLIARVGPAKAISVTFLIPLFAVAWGWLVLAESVTPVMMGAGAVILAGTALATGLVRRPG
jgi:drug/metabolite transporter (DMT)-like permease